MELFKRGYDATVNRGLITPNTKKSEFLAKLKEEVFEWEMELIDDLSKKRQIHEAGDIITVMVNYLIHSGVDPVKVLTEIVEKNESRID